MSLSERREAVVHRLVAALRAADLYAPDHPLLRRNTEAFAAVCQEHLNAEPQLVIGLVGDEIVVNDTRVQGLASAVLDHLAHKLRGQDIEKVTFRRGVSRKSITQFLQALNGPASQSGLDEPASLESRLARLGVERIAVGQLTIDEADNEESGIAVAKRIYGEAVQTAETLWDQAKTGELPDPSVAGTLIDSLSKAMSEDRLSLMALTALKGHDNYTFTHMVNVSVLSLAQGRSLGLEGPLLREFGFAALMHDIGKVQTPLEILNKPGKLDPEEFEIMKQHVVDGAHILRRTPEMPALATIVAFEHHLKQDLSGYPEKVAYRKLNLCTMIVTIADVFDALRSTRPYREGLASDRVKAIMVRQNDPSFQPQLLKRFVNLMGLFPVGNLVRLSTEEVAVVTAEHPHDPFRPQVRLLLDARGDALEAPTLVNTWERDERGDFPCAVIEAVDPDSVDIDPLTLL